MGRAAHPWRIAKAWHRYRADNGCEVHGEEEAPILTRLEDLPSQSCGQYCVDRLVRGADDLVSAVIRAFDPATCTARAAVGRSNRPSDCRMAQQFTEAFGWRDAPRYVVRDRDRIYGARFIHRVRAMSIRDRPTSARSPWQSGYAERLIGSIRRDCLDHVVVFSERHLRTLLGCYQTYYNECRTHLSLGKDAPLSRPVQVRGRIAINPILGGLHHQYCRI